MDIKRSGSHSIKRYDYIHVAPAKGDFSLLRVEYFLPRSDSYSPLLDTMTKSQLVLYMKYLKSRSLQTYFGPLVQMLMQHKDNHGIFNTPVDPEAQNLPTYYSIISKPMDLGTIRDRLASGEYQTQRDILNDISLVFKNAQKFNPPSHFVNLCAASLQRVFENEVDKIRSRIEQNRVNQANHFCASCRGTPCRICGEKCLKYSPPVFVCDGDCHGRILRNATYYIIRGKKGRYCQKCYAKKIVGMDKADRKNLFVKKKNDEVFPESWVQCSRCREWLHCICGLVHPRQVTNSYVCPICLSEDPRRVVKPVQGAMAIPTCPLSDFLTQQIYLCVDAEVQKLPQRLRLTEAALSQLKENLIVRVVSNITTSVTVKKAIAPLYTSSSAGDLSLPYRSKCIAFFQHRNGMDILLFVLYVHEFGEDSTPANRRCVYISYLDSVHFLSPRYLRTPLYHTILSAYLAYAKSNGYCRAFIWACPPSRGDDYIFPHHPRDQRTPNADHLIGWYRTLLAKAVDAGIVSHVSCQLDELLHINAVRSNSPDINQRQIRCFSIRGVTETELPEAVLERMQTSPLLSSPLSSDYETDNENENENESDMSSDMSSMSTATTPVSSDPSPRPGMSVLPTGSLSEAERVLLLTIPYFEGDYLPYVCEDLLKEMYQESIKPKTSRNTLSHVSSMSSSTKNKAELRDRILQDNIQQLPSEFLRKYAKSMLENPARFMIVYLRPTCSYCGEIIVGRGVRCDECFVNSTPFFLCCGCSQRRIYHAHSLSPIQQPSLPPVVERDPAVSYPFLDKRHEFLRLCQGNFLQFDTLRHSVLSTSMVMEFIFHKVPDPFLDLCDSCEKILCDEYYVCRYRDDYRLCKDCLERDGGLHAKNHLEDCKPSQSPDCC